MKNYPIATYDNWTNRSRLGRWITGHLLDFGRESGKSHVVFDWRLSQIRECGAHVIRIFHKPILLVYSPELVRFFLNLDPQSWIKLPMTTRIFPAIMQKSLICKSGSDWKSHQRHFTPFFHLAKLQKFTDHFVKSAEKLTELWRKRGEGGKSFLIDADIHSLTIKSIMQSLLGMDLEFSNDQNDSKGIIHSFMVLCRNVEIPKSIRQWIPKLPLLWRFTERGNDVQFAMDKMNRLVAGVSAASHKRKDVSDLAYYITTKTTMTAKELTADIFAFIFAGHETSKNTLIWCLYELASSAELQDEIFEEYQAMMKKNKDLSSFINRDTLLTSFISEVQRFYSVAPELAPRILTKDTMMPNGTVAPAGTCFNIGIWESHMNPYTWHEPHIFKPKRFQEEEIPTCAFLPFSMGVRKCIGYKYAILQLRAVLIVLVRSFRFKLDPDHNVIKTRIMTISPHNGVKMTIEPRDDL